MCSSDLPQVCLSPSSLSFTNQPVGIPSPALSITISNCGRATLNISGIGVIGANSGDFSYSAPACSTIAAGSSCLVSVRFTPTLGGNRSAALAITNDATGSPSVITLTGKACGDFTFTPSSLPNATQYRSFSQQLAASGGATPFTYSVTGGALPSGLALSSSGLLSGTPTQIGSYTFTVAAVDLNGCSSSQVYSLTVGCGTINIVTTSFSAGTVGVAYSQQMAVTGGTAPLQYFVTDGSLPAGLALSASGLLSGTPLAVGQSTFTVAVIDAQGCIASRQYTMTIQCSGLTILPAALPDAKTGVAYSQQLSFPTGKAPFTLTRIAGAFPAGISVDSNGILGGTPTQKGIFNFTLNVVDANGCAGQRSYTLKVTCPPVVITPASLPEIGRAHV